MPVQLFSENPLPNIDYIKYNCDFQKLKDEYKSSFPDGIDVINTDSNKNKAFGIVSEDINDYQRTIEGLTMLVNEMEQKPRTCILYVSHGHHIAGVSNLFDLLSDEFKLSTLQNASEEDIS